mmetsp:Transcript_779/g.1647  ORF Transcript_779/g.1647 Transcript_779/m.1647 type:complete len:252 (+) Transcript_779:229-984(+)
MSFLPKCCCDVCCIEWNATRIFQFFSRKDRSTKETPPPRVPPAPYRGKTKKKRKTKTTTTTATASMPPERIPAASPLAAIPGFDRSNRGTRCWCEPACARTSGTWWRDRTSTRDPIRNSGGSTWSYPSAWMPPASGPTSWPITCARRRRGPGGRSIWWGSSSFRTAAAAKRNRMGRTTGPPRNRRTRTTDTTKRATTITTTNSRRRRRVRAPPKPTTPAPQRRVGVAPPLTHRICGNSKRPSGNRWRRLSP